MKQLIFIIILTHFIACSPAKTQKENQNPDSPERNFGQELIESDFLKYADSLKKDTLKKAIINSFNIYEEDNYKLTPIDAEELAEYNFDFFLPRLNKILLKRGFQLEVHTANDYEKTNNIFINNHKINLYTNQELESQTSWNSAPRNFFRKVNKLLKEKNIEEQFYLLYGGNDLHTFLLTEVEFMIISERYKNEINEIPHLP